LTDFQNLSLAQPYQGALESGVHLQ